MPSLRGTADEAELVPPRSFFSGGTTSAWSASVCIREGPPPRGPRRFVFGRDHLRVVRVVRVVRVGPRRFSQSASV